MARFALSVTVLSLGLLVPVVPAVARQDEKKPSQDEKKTQEDAAKKAIADFTEKMKDAKGIPDKALAIMAFGNLELKDKLMVSALAKYLNPVPGDLNFVLLTVATDALGTFRGCPQAAAALSCALAGYKKNPFIAAKITTAIGQVGHESSLPALEEHFKGTDSELAVQAVWVVADFPGPIALETLFRENDRIEKERKKQSLKDEVKKVYDRVQPEIIKAIKKVSGQPWPTIAELTIWWNKHAPQFKEECARKEKERRTGGGVPSTSLPPVLLVEMAFKENSGTLPGNAGSSGATFPTATMTERKPSWTGTAPGGRPSAMDFDRTGGAYAVDLGGGNGIENLKKLKSFTITGWTLCREVKEGPSDKQAGAGNRMVSWFNPLKVNEGVELVYRTDGSLQLGIGQWADASPARSKPAIIPAVDPKAKDENAEIWMKWRFFAVTYDSGLASSHVKFYSASQNEDVMLVNAVDYDRGPSGTKISSHLTIGNLPPQTRLTAPDRTYRGILSEIRIYGSTLDGSGALRLEELLKIQNRLTQ